MNNEQVYSRCCGAETHIGYVGRYEIEYRCHKCHQAYSVKVKLEPRNAGAMRHGGGRREN